MEIPRSCGLLSSCGLLKPECNGKERIDLPHLPRHGKICGEVAALGAGYEKCEC